MFVPLGCGFLIRHKGLPLGIKSKRRQKFERRKERERMKGKGERGDVNGVGA